MLHLFPKTIHFFLLAILISSFTLVGCSEEDPEVRYKELLGRAAEFKEEDKFEEARITLQSAIDVKPNTAQGYFELAEILIRQKQFGKASENYRTAINIDPEFWEARLHLASLLLAAQQYELAEDHIRKLREQNPEDLEAHVLEANFYAARKKLDKAKTMTKEILEKDPNLVIALATLADIELQQGNPELTEEYLNRALKVEPENEPLRLALADLYSRQGRLDESQELIEGLVTNRPDDARLRYFFGEFLIRRGMGERAVDQYRATLEADPFQVSARDRLYDMYMTRDDVESAKALTAELIAEDAEHPSVLYFKGRDLELEGDIKGALDNYLKAIAVLNDFAPLFRRAGLIEMSLGETEAGIQHLQQSIALDPGDIGARLALARDLFLKREFGAAKEHVNKVLAIYPRQLGANILRADIALVEGDTDAAKRVYDFLIESFPGSPLGYFKRALLFERTGNVDGAIENYIKTVSFKREILVPLRRLAALLAKEKGGEEAYAKIQELSKEYSDGSDASFEYVLGLTRLANRNENALRVAKGHFQKALELESSLMQAYWALAQLNTLEGNTEEAITNYKKVIEDDDSNVGARMLLALTYEMKGDKKLAVEEYKEILRINSRFGPAANNLAWAIAENPEGDLETALRHALVAKEELPNEPGVADTLGWIYFKKGSPRVALPLLEEAVEGEKKAAGTDSVNPEILYHLAEAHNALGNKEEAKKAIDKVVSVSSPEVSYFERAKELQASLMQ